MTNGWLKPKLLLEVTGTPAAEKIASEIAQRLKLEKKRKQIEEYKQSLGLINNNNINNDDDSSFNLDQSPTKAL